MSSSRPESQTVPSSVYTSPLFLALMALLGVGLVQVYTASFILASENHSDALFFFKKQLLYVLVGLAVMLTLSRVSFALIEKHIWMVWLAAGLGVLLTLVPGLGVKAGGASRWLQLPLGFRVQPSELLIYSFTLFVGSWMCRRDRFLGRWPGWLGPLLVVVPVVLLLKQPDFGSFAMIVAVALGLLVAYGLKWRYLLAMATVVVPLFYFLVMRVEYRRARILAFLDPWADAEQKGFQVIQSMMSMQAGGMSGVGLGQGQGKLFFLPEAHTDFTLAVAGEEWGFLGVLTLLLLYGFVVFRCFQLAALSNHRFRQILALGTGMTFALAVFTNAGVVMGLLPTKGLALPFLSYGGSSLMTLCFMFGLILNVERCEIRERQNTFFRL